MCVCVCVCVYACVIDRKIEIDGEIDREREYLCVYVVCVYTILRSKLHRFALTD